jgi:Fe-Mn family superoxide dismutase
MLTRRDLIRSATAGAAAMAIPTLPSVLQAADPKGFTLPKLPYAFDALEPAIDARTMEIHHDKHHAAYVANLNKALANHPDLLAKPVIELVRDFNKLPMELRTPVRNNGGGHLNHTWFWQMMTKPGGEGPKGELLKAIDASFGNLDGFKKAFTAAAMSQFGSGWAWLVKGTGKEKPLVIIKAANQDNPVTIGRSPILGIDVWEHAYYLKYQNKRNEYVNAWYSVINWPFVTHLYTAK